jgi:hypothetical protein
VIPGGTILIDLDLKKKSEEQEKKRDYLNHFRSQMKARRDAASLVDQLQNLKVEKNTELFSKGNEISKKKLEREGLILNEAELVASDSLRFKIQALSSYLDGLSSYASISTNTKEHWNEMRSKARNDLNRYRSLAGDASFVSGVRGKESYSSGKTSPNEIEPDGPIFKSHDQDPEPAHDTPIH